MIPASERAKSSPDSCQGWDSVLCIHTHTLHAPPAHPHPASRSGKEIILNPGPGLEARRGEALVGTADAPGAAEGGPRARDEQEQGWSEGEGERAPAAGN